MARKFILNSLIFLLDIYKRIFSPLLPNSCRFYPSCSNYSKEALSEYGILKGVFLSIVRLIKCNPFCSGGYDPVNKKSAQ